MLPTIRRLYDAEHFFLAAALVSGVAFAAVTVPFHVPDEPVHFYRAFAISEGALTAEARPGRTGAMLPVSLAALVDLFTDSIAHPPSSGVAATLASPGIDPEVFTAARRIPLEPERRAFLDFPTAAVTTPLTYLPQATAIAVGRLLGAPPLALLYLARLANLLAATMMIRAGLRQLPAYRWLGVAIALTPMAVFLRSSVSADTLTFAIAFLFVATVARLAFGDQETIRRRDVALLCLLAAGLCLTKAAYAPLIAAAAIIPARRLRDGQRGTAILAYAVTTAGAFVLAAIVARSVDTPFKLDAGVDPDRQVAAVLGDPLSFLEIAVADYLRHGPRYAAELVGRLGWLDTPLPTPLIASYLIVLLALLGLDTRRQITVEAWQRTLLAAAAAATLLLISASLYAVYTPVGAGFVAGVQGRYYLPVLPVAAWMFHSRRWAGAVADRRLGLATGLFCTLALAVSLVVLIRR